MNNLKEGDHLVPLNVDNTAFNDSDLNGVPKHGNKLSFFECKNRSNIEHNKAYIHNGKKWRIRDKTIPSQSIWGICSCCSDWKVFWKLFGANIFVAMACLDPGNISADISMAMQVGYSGYWILLLSHFLLYFYQDITLTISTILYLKI